MHSRKHPLFSAYPPAEWANGALTYVNNSSLISIRIVLIFFLKLNRSAISLDCMSTSSPMSRKASSSFADRNMDKSVGPSTQSCLTSFFTLNDSETSAMLSFAIIPVCRASIIVVNFSGHTYVVSSCHSLIHPTVSNALLTNTTYSGRSCSMHFYCSCRRQNIISMVLPLPLKSHCVSRNNFGVIWLDSLLILANIWPAMERKEIPILLPQYVRPPFL